MRTPLSLPWPPGKTKPASDRRDRKVWLLALTLLAAMPCSPLPILAAQNEAASAAAPAKPQGTEPPPIAPDPLSPQSAPVVIQSLAQLLDQAATRQTTPADRKALLIRFQSLRDGRDAPALRGANAGQTGTDTAAAPMTAAGTEMVLHMLRRAVGDQIFADTAKTIAAAGEPVDWNGVQRAFTASAAAPLDVFFTQWLDRPELPRITINKVATEEQDGKVRLSFTLAQEQTTPLTLPVPVRITTPVEVVTREIPISAAETPVTITLPDLPTELLIDPEYHLLRPLPPDEYPPVWARYRNAAKKLAVVPDGLTASPYAPLVERLRALGCETIPAGTVKDTDIAGRNVLFLGLDTPMARALFARPDHPATGFTLDVRANPLGPAQVAVLISSASADETTLAMPRLFDELDLATFAHLAGGATQEERTQTTDMGLGWWLDPPPAGVALADRLGFGAIMERLREIRVIFVGESHDKLEDHRLQLRVIRAMHRQSPKLAIGMEMFPRSTQEVLDAYVAGTIDEREFLKKSNYFKNWGFDYRFYRDIVNFARANRLPIVALNLDKGITSKVFRNGGLTALSPEEEAKIPAERDLGLPGYRERITGVFTMHDQHTTPEQVNSFFQAQALWDETMAESAAGFLGKNPEYRLAMVVGHGHALKDTAIPPRIARRLPVTQAVIMAARERGMTPAEADYLISVEPVSLPPLPVLGVQLADSDKGIQVMGLSPEGKAGEAGIEEGDYLLSLDDGPIATVEDLKLALFYRKKGETVRVKVLRPRKILPDKTLIIAVPL